MIKVTPLAFITKALVNALKEFPNFNASIDTKQNKIIYKNKLTNYAQACLVKDIIDIMIKIPITN